MVHRIFTEIILKAALFAGLLSLGSVRSAGTPADISVTKGEDGRWSVTYELAEPARQIGFVRNPDQSRTERWHPISSDFQVAFEDGREFIRRVDGNSFEQVTLDLTPTYKHLSKDYAPFSPYSEGGTLFYSGRLFACTGDCDGSENSWRVSLSVPEDDHVILKGKIARSPLSWVDRNDGQNIYVGKQEPIEASNVIAIIDTALPASMQNSLATSIPALMEYFESRLGPLPGETKPMLYASYARVPGQSSQGGTLPGQIFMHWNVNNLDEVAENNDFVLRTLWFFAHEVAHLYQAGQDGVVYPEAEESWIHEGHADFLASQALTELYPGSEAYITRRFDQARSTCGKGLAGTPLNQAATTGKFHLYYSCGMLIHQYLDRHARASGSDTYSIWRAFRVAVAAGETKTGETFLKVSARVSKDLDGDMLRSFTSTQLINPTSYLDVLSGKEVELKQHDVP